MGARCPNPTSCHSRNASRSAFKGPEESPWITGYFAECGGANVFPTSSCLLVLFACVSRVQLLLYNCLFWKIFFWLGKKVLARWRVYSLSGQIAARYVSSRLWNVLGKCGIKSAGTGYYRKSYGIDGMKSRILLCKVDDRDSYPDSHAVHTSVHHLTIP